MYKANAMRDAIELCYDKVNGTETSASVVDAGIMNDNRLKKKRQDRHYSKKKIKKNR